MKEEIGEMKMMEKEKEELPRHHAIRLDAMLEAVKLPAGIADLDAGLPDVYAYDLPHLPIPSTLCCECAVTVTPQLRREKERASEREA